MPKGLRILFSGMLFLYQSALDVYRGNLHTGLSHSYLNEELFLLIFIIHRSIIHGLIIYLLTGRGFIWRYYVLIDFTLLLVAYLLKLINEHVFALPDFFEYLNNTVFFKMLNTPILLLFFLPAYYLLKKNSYMKLS